MGGRTNKTKNNKNKYDYDSTKRYQINNGPIKKGNAKTNKKKNKKDKKNKKNHSVLKKVILIFILLIK